MLSESDVNLLKAYYESQKGKSSDGKEFISIALLERMLLAEIYSIVLDIRRLLLESRKNSCGDSSECRSNSDNESPDT